MHVFSFYQIFVFHWTFGITCFVNDESEFVFIYLYRALRIEGGRGNDKHNIKIF